MNNLLQLADLSLVEILKLIWPVIIIQLILQIYCVIKVIKEGTRNLNKLIWIVIILALNILGPITYLIFGTSQE
jgi:hypothetical protein